jgi:hypothetical protein
MSDPATPPDPTRALVLVIEDIPPLQEAVHHPQQGDCMVILAPVEYEHAVRWLRLGLLRATWKRPDAEVVSREPSRISFLVPREDVEAMVTEVRAASTEFRRRLAEMPLDDLVADHRAEALPFIEETGAEVRLHPAEALRGAGLRLAVDGDWIEVN